MLCTRKEGVVFLYANKQPLAVEVRAEGEGGALRGQRVCDLGPRTSFDT